MNKNLIKEVAKSMQGVLLPKRMSKDFLLEDINRSLKDLEFYGPAYDKKNMKNDAAAFHQDMNKAVRENGKK